MNWIDKNHKANIIKIMLIIVITVTVIIIQCKNKNIIIYKLL